MCFPCLTLNSFCCYWGGADQAPAVGPLALGPCCGSLLWAPLLWAPAVGPLLWAPGRPPAVGSCCGPPVAWCCEFLLRLSLCSGEFLCSSGGWGILSLCSMLELIKLIDCQPIGTSHHLFNQSTESHSGSWTLSAFLQANSTRPRAPH